MKGDDLRVSPPRTQAMVDLGVSLISEEHGPNALVDAATRAETAGFEFALVSDHFHPWLAEQGESPFVWTTLGGIARETSDLRVGTGVTCPLFRIHPVNVAHGAATVASMHPGEFFLGVGTGENLNEHVTGKRWPPHDRRLRRLEEAIEVIRGLWEGETYSHHGEYYTVENAKLYTVPDDPPPIHVAAGGPQTADFASQLGDGFISTSPDGDLIERFEADGDGDRPTHGQMTVCWAETEAEARETAYEQWRNTAVPGELSRELPTPAHFEQAAQPLDVDDVASKVTCGPDAEDHIEMIDEYVEAGYDYVSIHQVGSNLREAFEFYEQEVLPSFA